MKYFIIPALIFSVLLARTAKADDCNINDAECFREKYVESEFKRKIAENKAKVLEKDNRDLKIWGENQSWRAAEAEFKNEEKPNPYFWYSAGIVSGVVICIIIGFKAKVQ
jgi:hypothetical protein